MDLYSVVCVRDRTAARKWFEVFFGRPADEVIGEEYLWQAGENAWIVIDDRPMRAARVGGTMITLGVTNLDDILARLPQQASSTSRWRPTATASATWRSSTPTATACRSRRHRLPASSRSGACQSTELGRGGGGFEDSGLRCSDGEGGGHCRATTTHWPGQESRESF